MTGLAFPQPTVTKSQPSREVISPKQDRSDLADVLRIVFPVILTVASTLTAIQLSNRHSRKLQDRMLQESSTLQTERLKHEAMMLDIKHAREEMKDVQEWFLRVYTTEAIEPLESLVLWLNRSMLYDSDERIPTEMQWQTYNCLSRLSTVINQLIVVQLIELPIAAMFALSQVRHTDPTFYHAHCQPLKARLSVFFKGSTLYFNQLQEAMRFTILNHRSDVYHLGKNERFLAFTARAEKLIEDLNMQDYGQFLEDAAARGETGQEPRQ